MEGPTKVVVLPIFRRYWLWHAWSEGSAVATLAEEASAAGRKTLRDWRQGQNLEEKTQLLGQHATRWVSEPSLGAGLTAAAAAACLPPPPPLPGFEGAAVPTLLSRPSSTHLCTPCRSSASCTRSGTSWRLQRRARCATAATGAAHVSVARRCSACAAIGMVLTCPAA
jgi:hypothetical protein